MAAGDNFVVQQGLFIDTDGVSLGSGPAIDLATREISDEPVVGGAGGSCILVRFVVDQLPRGRNAV